MKRIKNFGEFGLLIEFDQIIDIGVNKKVHHLASLLDLHFAHCITKLTPAFCSLFVLSIPGAIKKEDFIIEIWKLGEQLSSSFEWLDQRRITLPVCYDESFALDLNELQGHFECQIEDIISSHSNTFYHSYMTGFLPGFAYLGPIAPILQTKRKNQPRKLVPEGAVGIAETYTAVYPSNSPAGWHIIGNCPVPLIDKNDPTKSLIRSGDAVQFVPINKERYYLTKEKFKKKELSWEDCYE